MAAQTFTGSEAGDKVPVPHYAGGGIVLSRYTVFAIPETPEAGDVYEFFKLPKGAVPIGGYAGFTDIDTGAETLEIDIGIAANGVDDADPDYFANSGVLSGDAILDLPLTNAASVRLFTGPFPVEQLGAETMVQGEVIAVAAAGGTGNIAVRVDYLMPGESTS